MSTNDQMPANMVTSRCVRALAALLPVFLFACLLSAGLASCVRAGIVTAVHTPDNGLQPQAAVDSTGELHLIYFKGEPNAGDIFYVHRPLAGTAPFSDPIRVNSQPKTAIATGTIRGPQMAIGKNNRIHVVWNGVGPQGNGGHATLYTAYTRMNIEGTGFDDSRDMSSNLGSVDGGGSVAADSSGDVFVVWHLSFAGQDESRGNVFLAYSGDNGRRFLPARRINPMATGQCGCCSLRAFADSRGALYVLYRSAQANVSRDTTLLFSEDKGRTFQSKIVQRWQANVCPMTTFSLSEGRKGVVGAWETQEQVWFSPLTGSGRLPGPPTAAPGTGRRKYPFVLSNSYGDTLLAWVEGAGWERGGALAWQVFGADGKPTAQKGRVDGVPAWSLVSGAVRPEGTFVLFY